MPLLNQRLASFAESSRYRLRRVFPQLKRLRPKTKFQWLLVLVVLWILILVAPQLLVRKVIIERFSVPKEFESMGLDGETLSRATAAQLKEINVVSQYALPGQKIALPIFTSERVKLPDIQMPGTTLGTQTITDIASRVIGDRSVHVAADIVSLSTDPKSQSPLKVNLLLRVISDDENERVRSVVIEAGNTQVFASKIAETAFEELDPANAAVYFVMKDPAQVDDTALEVLNRAIYSGRFASDRRYLGSLYSMKGNLDSGDQERLTDFKRAYSLNPNSEVLVDWGGELVLQKKTEAAEMKFKEAISRDRKKAEPHWALCRLYRAEKRLKEAEREKELALKGNGTFKQREVAWGFDLIDEQKPAEAEKKARYFLKENMSVKDDKSATDSLALLATALFLQNKYQEAIESIKRAEHLLPPIVTKFVDGYVVKVYYQSWANSLEQEGKLPEALQKLGYANELDPADVDIYVSRARLLRKLGAAALAVKEFERAALVNPRKSQVFEEWGKFLEFTNDTAAAEHFKQAAEIDPSESFSLYKWGNILSHQGKQEEAINKYREAIIRNPSDSLSYAGWGKVLVQQNKTEEALKKFKEGHARDSKNSYLLLSWAELLVSLKRMDEANEKYRSAVAASPDSSYFLLKWSDFLRSTGQPELALVQLRRALEIDKDDFVILNGLAEVNLTLGNRAEAASYCEKAKTLTGFETSCMQSFNTTRKNVQ